MKPRPALGRHMVMRIGARVAVGALGVGLLVAGCASGPSVSSESAPSALLSPSLAGASPSDLDAAVAASRASAEHDAVRLLALAQVPPGAKEISTPPATLPGPALGTPQTDSLIDHARYWRVAMSLKDAIAWVQAHPPSGLTSNGSGSESDHDVLVEQGFSYVGADGGGQLEIGVAADGESSSYIRADGVTEWLDPRPVRDDADGKRLVATVAAGCPSSDRGFAGVENVGSDLDAALLPSGSPTVGLLCEYEGMNGKPFSLLTQKLLDAAAASRLAATARAISLSHTDGDVHSCPMADGSADLLVFSYSGRSDVGLFYLRNGCQTISNGRILASPDDAFVELMGSLLPH